MGRKKRKRKDPAWLKYQKSREADEQSGDAGTYIMGPLSRAVDPAPPRIQDFTLPNSWGPDWSRRGHYRSVRVPPWSSGATLQQSAANLSAAIQQGFGALGSLSQMVRAFYGGGDMPEEVKRLTLTIETRNQKITLKPKSLAGVTYQPGEKFLRVKHRLQTLNPYMVPDGGDMLIDVGDIAWNAQRSGGAPITPEDAPHDLTTLYATDKVAIREEVQAIMDLSRAILIGLEGDWALTDREKVGTVAYMLMRIWGRIMKLKRFWNVKVPEEEGGS